MNSLANPVSKAPWGKALRIVSAVATILCLSITVIVAGHTRFSASQWHSWLGILPLIIVATCALFTVRGYRVNADKLVIQRLLWETVIPLDGLLSVSVERHAMRTSIRTCGNGGLFSFSGWYWNRRLGVFRAFVTDLRKTVVLRFADRTLVLSPENPEEFVRRFRGCRRSV